MPVCGSVAWYNLPGLPDGPGHGPQIIGTVLRMKVKIKGFIIYNSFPRSLYKELRADMATWLDRGKIGYEEQVVDGLENAPAALNDLLTGRSFGKVVVRVD